MKTIHRVMFATALLLSSSGPSWAGLVGVVVRFEPPVTTVQLNDVFTVDLVADIVDPVVGWGLDLDLSTPGIASQTIPPGIATPPWVSIPASDGDGLAALADPFAPFFGSVSGNGVLLATLSFHADAIGNTDLAASSSLGDLAEGFALDPFGFANVQFNPGHVTVIPEPATRHALLCILAIAACRRRGFRG